MADRQGVRRASSSVAVIDLIGLGGAVVNALAKVPLRHPLSGADDPVRNLGTAVTREVLRAFLGYTTSLPIEEFRSVEAILDRLCVVALAPVVAAAGVTRVEGELGGIDGEWYRPSSTPEGTVLYFHGGGYVGTSPSMYAVFAAGLARSTRCEVFVADYRLAPEFPFPAGLNDAIAVLKGAIREGHPPLRVFVAGDSGGGGLASALMCATEMQALEPVAGLILLSPEVDLRLDKPSVRENASTDILPWNVPTTSYLQGTDPGEGCVSAINQSVGHWPSTIVLYGGAEMFRDAIRLLVDRLRAAGVTTTSVEAPAMFHVYPIVMPWHPAARAGMSAIGEFVRQHLEVADVRPVT